MICLLRFNYRELAPAASSEAVRRLHRSLLSTSAIAADAGAGCGHEYARRRMIATEMPRHADWEDRTRFCLDCPRRSTNDSCAKPFLRLIGLNHLQSLAPTCRSVDGPAGRRSSLLCVERGLAVLSLCCGPAPHFPGGALTSQERGTPPTARCSIPVERTFGDSRGSQAKATGDVEYNATGNISPPLSDWSSYGPPGL